MCCWLQLARDSVDSDLFGESYHGFGGFSPCDATVTTIKRETFKMLDAAHRADLVRLMACVLLETYKQRTYGHPCWRGQEASADRPNWSATSHLQGWLHPHAWHWLGTAG